MSESPRTLSWGKIIVALMAVGLAAFLLYFFRHDLSLAALAERESTLRAWYSERPLLTLALAFAVYVLVTGLSLPGASVLSLAYGWLFGFATGLVLVSFASTSGAIIAFLLSRYVLRDAIQQRFGPRLADFNERLDREGAMCLFTLRLIPAVPFFVINLVMGLTEMRLRTFWWVSQLGMLPGTCVYLWAGASVPSLTKLTQPGISIVSPQLIIAFIALGLFPWLARFIVARFRAI